MSTVHAVNRAARKQALPAPTVAKRALPERHQ